MATAQERERNWLKRRGFDGLYYPDPAAACGCWTYDLYPCGDRPKECCPGRQDIIDGVLGIYGPASPKE